MKRWIVNIAMAAGAATAMVVIAAGGNAAARSIPGSETVAIPVTGGNNPNPKDPGEEGCWDWQLTVPPPE